MTGPTGTGRTKAGQGKPTSRQQQHHPVTSLTLTACGGKPGVRELLDGPVGKPAETNRAKIGEAWKGYRSVARTLARTNRGQDRRQAAAWGQQRQNQAQPARPEPAQPAQPVPPEPTQPEPAQPEPVQTTAQQESAGANDRARAA